MAPQETIIQVIHRACQTTLETLKHEPSLFDDLSVNHSISHSTPAHPRFQVQMIYQDYHTGLNGTATVTLRSPIYLYSLENLHLLLRTYVRLLNSCIWNPKLPITRQLLYDDNDSMVGLVLGQGPRLEITNHDTISKRIEQMSLFEPDTVAVKDADSNGLTYKQMQQHIQCAAAALQTKGVLAHDCVAVHCEPTVYFVCHMLAIWRLNAIYVPLDPQNAFARLQTIVDDCRPTAFIYHDSTKYAIRQLNLHSSIPVSITEICSSQAQTIPDFSRPESAACVLYTSGSTGTPKGIVLTHDNLLHQILGVRHRYGIGREIALQQSCLGFDVSLDQMLQPLLGGGTLIVAPRRLRGDAIALSRLILAEGVTYTYATPSEYMMLLRYGSTALEQLSSWRIAFVGGEALPRHLIQLFRSLRRPGLWLINRYGPTEVSISSSCLAIDTFDPACVKLQPITVGWTLPNYSTYILNTDGAPLPVGFTGEIVVSGPGVAQGYLHKDTLTKQRFLPDSLMDDPDPSRRPIMYRTGDKGRLLPTGELVFLGRIDGDHQVKLRGYRIELDDISNTILRSADGRLIEAVVSVRGLHDAEGDRRFLVAFVVPACTQAHIPVNEMLNFLDELVANLPLPTYMLPHVIIPVDELPRNPNGKLDRQAVDRLPLPSKRPNAMSPMAVSDSERFIMWVWEQCLDLSVQTAVWGPATDFFQLGGNSLLMVKVQAFLQQHLGRPIPLPALFRSSTIEDMASLLTGAPTTPPESTIDWEQETLPVIEEKYICDGRSINLSPLHVDGAIEVCLTGSTGFLGSAILKCLVTDPRVARIHCSYRSAPLSVSSAAGATKVVRYKCDLTAPRMGLDRASWHELASRVDLIIHNGADVSFLKSYRSLQPANVQSTRALAQMALRRCLPLHFVSTADVAQLSDLESVPPQSVAHCKPPTEGADGYLASKWVSEVYLEKCAAQFQLPCAIHRPTNIVGEGMHGTDFMQGLIQWSLRIHQVPALDHWTGFFDFVSVTEVAMDITEAALRSVNDRRETSATSDTPTFHHHSSDHPVPVSEFRDFLEQRFRVPLRTVDPDTWLEHARKEGLSGLLESVMAANLTDPRPRRLARMLRE
ncbi:acetyl-CoA synthetase-like protein [Aspergillus saccharolyticus JOP 1030-1]|uniref:Acetyl-CoA synthetase-like protein n=1 Tax=Aspergillus saccharolyticus JOP 1030-1 TaxID=1450539 RepID=A0A318ZZ16_9EURO|nr:acetyl-CoA synthetase-like protein [Aspergillus saccharolyticus JOP 1030-1]PYH49450.1 acetyl-CoA synthetase-like protein [Aspergillus saccharolyticus JOP 1030-1]